MMLWWQWLVTVAAFGTVVASSWAIDRAVHRRWRRLDRQEAFGGPDNPFVIEFREVHHLAAALSRVDDPLFHPPMLRGQREALFTSSVAALRLRCEFGAWSVDVGPVVVDMLAAAGQWQRLRAADPADAAAVQEAAAAYGRQVDRYVRASRLELGMEPPQRRRWLSSRARSAL